ARWRATGLSAALHAGTAAGGDPVDARRRAHRQQTRRNDRGARRDHRKKMRGARRRTRNHQKPSRLSLVAKNRLAEVISRKPYNRLILCDFDYDVWSVV